MKFLILILFITNVSLFGQANKNRVNYMTPSEELLYTTIRIEATVSNNGIITGTGFFFDFKETGDIHIPVIITNKHVIENTNTGYLFFNLADYNRNLIEKSKHCVTIKDFTRAWILHPDKNVDLAVDLPPISVPILS